MAQLGVFGGILVGRVVSFAASGGPGALIYYFGAVEVVGALLALLALRGASAPSVA